MKTRMTPNSRPFRALALGASLAVSAHAQTVWQGSGAGGAAGASNWNDGANWTVGVPTNVTATVAFTGNGVAFVNAAGLPAAGKVTLTGAGDGSAGTNRAIRVGQDITWDSFDYTPQASTRFGLRVDVGKTLTLSGTGDVYKVNAVNSTEEQAVYLLSTSKIRFTGTNLTLATGGTQGLNFGGNSGYTVEFAASNAVVDMNGRSLTMNSSGGTLILNGGQTWNRTPLFTSTRNTSISNAGGTALSMPVTVLNWEYASLSGSYTNSLAGGTFAEIYFRNQQSSASFANLALLGDVTTLSNSSYGGFSIVANNAAVGARVSLNGHTLFVANTNTVVNIGASGNSGTNILEVNGGQLRGLKAVVLGAGGNAGNALSLSGNGSVVVTNAGSTGSLDVRLGTLSMAAGSSITVDGFFATNGANSVVSFAGGTLKSAGTTVRNGAQFVVGDGSSAATYQMVGFGSHSFTNGLRLSSNASLKGSGMIRGDVSGATGSVVQVGNSPGVVTNFGNWDNRGITLNLEIGNVSNLVLTPGGNYDLLAVTGAWTHGGSIVVDLANFTRPVTASNLALITWNAALGSALDTSVSFVNGSPLSWEFTSTSFIVTIPEPSAGLIVAMGMGMLAWLRRKAA